MRRMKAECLKSISINWGSVVLQSLNHVFVFSSLFKSDFKDVGMKGYILHLHQPSVAEICPWVDSYHQNKTATWMLLLVNVLHTHDNTRLHIKLIDPGCDKFEQIKLEPLNQYRAKMKISGTALSWTEMVVVSIYHLQLYLGKFNNLVRC